MKNTLLGGFIALLFLACNPGGTDPGAEATSADSTGSTTPSEPAAQEIADAKFADLGRNSTTLFASKDLDRWMETYADDARYYWSAGDSLIGKEAIKAYWKDRFDTTVDSISISNHIWLPVKVNKPQATETAGTWAIGWFVVNVKYRNGKELSFWAHSDHHFNANDKIDQTIMYIDRAPIVAAVGGK
jgi:hypothetical protein